MRIPHRNSVLKQGPDVTNIELQQRSCVAHRIKFSIDHTSHLCSLGRGFLDGLHEVLVCETCACVIHTINLYTLSALVLSSYINVCAGYMCFVKL